MRIDSDIEAEYARRKEALRNKFLAAMKDRHDILMNAVAKRGTDEQASLIQDCRFAAHKTAGTAAAFGYEKLGKTARATCDALDAVCDDATKAEALRCVEHFGSEIAELLESESADHKT